MGSDYKKVITDYRVWREDLKKTGMEDYASALLRMPTFFWEFLAMVEKGGLVGEKKNALVLYVTATSRVLDRPLNVFVKGPSSSGKNCLAKTVLDFMPPRRVHEITSTSNLAYFYEGKSLSHCVLYVQEMNGASGSLLQLRQLASEGKLIRKVAMRKGGGFRTETKVTEGPVAAISTTTTDMLEIDDENRHISIWVEGSEEQTRRILRAAVCEPAPLDDIDLGIWHAVQRHIEGRANTEIKLPPWMFAVADLVDADNLRVRRYWPAFLQACRAVSLIRSFQRLDFRPGGALTVDFTDFATAALIFDEAFVLTLRGGSDDDMDTAKVVCRLSNQRGGTGVDAKQIAEAMNISEDKSYAMLRSAVDTGTIRRANVPERGNRKLYVPAAQTRFVPDPAVVFQQLDGLGPEVRFVHPVSGKRIRYPGGKLTT